MNMNSKNMDMTEARSPRTYGVLGILSAILSILLLPEVFGSAAIILGAYQMRKDPDISFGMTVVVLGIICMLAGIYYTAYPLLIMFFPGFGF
ncbi:MAG: hypothetical protein WED04_09385 [Promethearchaeati archaeon SRVP18_Atabeyarchaeia-1]